MKNGKLGVALAGLGNYSTNQLAPALQQTAYCYLAGIVTGTPHKINYWKQEYNLPQDSCYDYKGFDNIIHNKEIDIVYIVLPNALHADFVIRAAKAGKHVICEKPMAISTDECDAMIEACKKAGVLLSIGYRLYFEPHNKELMRMAGENALGPVKLIETEHSLSYTSGWRIDKKLAGGGPLMDVGIYCVQAARYVTCTEPITVTAQEAFKKYKYKFKTVEEGINWQMEMSNGVIAHCQASYIKKQNRLKIIGEKGWAELSPAYSYARIQGHTSEGVMQYPQVFQQVLQMDDFARSIMENTPVTLPGEMGRQDIKILEAIYKAMKTGERIIMD